MANNTRYAIIVPEHIIDDLDPNSKSLTTKAGLKPSWFSGYSFDTSIEGSTIYTTVRSENYQFVEALSTSYPDDIIHVTEVPESDGRGKMVLWKNGEQLLSSLEHRSDFVGIVSGRLTSPDHYMKIFDGTWKTVFKDLSPVDVDENTLRLTIPIGGPLGSVMNCSSTVSITLDPLVIRIP